MPANQQIVIPAPSGVNITDESLETPATSAQQLAGLLCDRLGKIRSDINQVNACDLSLVASAPNVEPSSGLLYYIGEQVVSGTDIYGNPQNVTFPNVGTDFLLILIGQSLYNAQYQLGSYVPSVSALIPFVPEYPYSFQQPASITDGPNGAFLSTPSRIRGAQYANEMVIVQDGSITVNYRYYSICTNDNPFTSTTHIRTLGLPTPPALVLGTSISYHTPSGGHVARTGTPSYSVVYLDEFGRQSSPSIPVQLDFTSTNAGDDALISFTYVNPASYLAVAAIQIQEYVTGNPNGYIIYEQALVAGSNTITYEDGPTGTTDTTIEQGPVGPTPGENDPPNPASICWQYLDRICLNDNTNPDTLQISNAGSPTQFNLLGYNPNSPNPADGLRAPVNSDNGDAIVGGVSFGTFSVILKTRGLYYLYGQNSSNFQIQQVGGAVGCVAKDSVQVLNNGVIFYLYSDGVYAFDGSSSNKVSHQLDRAILGYNALTLSQAQSAYVNRRYWLNIGTDNWIFDQDANSGQGDWIYFAYGITALEFIQQQYGLPPIPNDPGYRGVPPDAPAGGPLPFNLPIVEPQPSSIPTIYFLHDLFNGGTVTLASHLPDIGAAWVHLSAGSLIGTADVGAVSNVRGHNSLPNDSAFYYNAVVPPTADYSVSMDIKIDTVSVLNSPEIFGRMSSVFSGSGGTYYGMYWSYNGGSWEIVLEKVAIGIGTQLGNYAKTPVMGQTHTFDMTMKGNKINAYLDGVLVIGPITDNSIAGPGFVGLGFSNNTPAWTDSALFQGMNLRANTI